MTVGPQDALFGQDGTAGQFDGDGPPDVVGPLPGFELPVVALPGIGPDGELTGLDPDPRAGGARPAPLAPAGAVLGRPAGGAEAPINHPARPMGTPAAVTAGVGAVSSRGLAGAPRPNPGPGPTAAVDRPSPEASPDAAGPATGAVTRPAAAMPGVPAPSAGPGAPGPSSGGTTNTERGAPDRGPGTPPAPGSLPARPATAASPTGAGSAAPMPGAAPVGCSASGALDSTIPPVRVTRPEPVAAAGGAGRAGWPITSEPGPVGPTVPSGPDSAQRRWSWSTGSLPAARVPTISTPEPSADRRPGAQPRSLLSGPARSRGPRTISSTATRPVARPRVVDEPGILGLSRHSRSRLGSRLFTLFFVLVFTLIAVQLIVALLAA